MNRLSAAFLPDHPSVNARIKPAYLPTDPLLTAAESATETGRGLSTFWRDVAAGRLPQPYRLTPKCPRWRRSELRAAVDACRARQRGAALMSAALWFAEPLAVLAMAALLRLAPI